jgi:membrane protease YdiL (CAAX protease family)
MEEFAAVAIFTTVVLCAIALVQFMRAADEWGWTSAGVVLHFRRQFRLAPRGIFSTALVLAVVWLVKFVLLLPAYHSLPTGLHWPQASGLGVGALVLRLAIAPIYEELVFRGGALSLLRRWLGAPLAAVVAAVLFALGHGVGTSALLFYVGGGVVYALIVLWAKSLTPAILAHAGWNLLALSLVW